MNISILRSNRMKVLFSLIVCVVIIFSNVVFSQDITKRNILVVSSKGKGHMNFREIKNAITATLGYDENYNIHVEMIDSKSNNDESLYKILYELYKYKFKDIKFDSIISCDDNSLEFLKKYHYQLFGKTPVVFCGVNESEDILKLNPDIFTGIMRQVDIKNTTDIGLQLHPDIKTIIIAANESTKKIYGDVFQQLEHNNHELEFIFLKEMKLEELQSKMQAFSGEAIFLCFSYLEDNNGNVISMLKDIGKLSSEYKIPVYSSFEFLIGNGIVGGMMSKGNFQGKTAAEMTLRILGGEKVSEIPIVRDSSNQYMFDFKEMKKHGIKLSDVPEDSIVINEHLNGFFISKDQFYQVVIPYFIIFLLAVIISQFIAIYKLKKVRQALKESEERLRSLINATPDLICFKDGDGRWIECNRSILETFNLNEKECIGKTDSELGDINELCKGAHLTCETTDKKAWEKGDIIQIEETVKLTDGSTKIYDMIKVPLFNHDGTRKGIVVLGRDITPRKDIEEKLRESQERYRILIELLPVTICLHSNDTIRFVNKAGAEMAGIRESNELVGRSISEFLHSDYHELFKKRMKEIENKGITVMPLCEEKIVTVEGEIVDVDVISKRFYYDGEEMTLTVLSDISERKRAEKLSQSIKDKERLLNETLEYDKLKTEFFANISHELRTPINVILGATQMFRFVLNETLLDDSLDKIETYLNMMQQNSFRLIRLVNNLIDITKMDSGFLEINLQNCNIISIVEDITLSVGAYIEYQNLDLVFDTEVEEKIMACDPDKIERIMLNLLSNAVKFTKTGGKIKVNVYDKGESIIISVKDNGLGIPDDKLEEIFKKFKQVDKSFMRDHEGSGIGLSLVKSLVEMHKGTIYAESEYGKGSEFVIELPVQIIEDGDVKTISDDMQQNHVERIHIEFSDIYV